MEEGFLCHLLSYAYAGVATRTFSKTWERLVRIHLVGKPSTNTGLQAQALTGEAVNNHLLSYAFHQEERSYAPIFNGSPEATMKVHLAGQGSYTTEVKRIEKVQNFLTTYAYPRELTLNGPLWEIPDLRPRVIVDSGAFTAWSTGKPVKIKDYAEWALNFDQTWRPKMATLRYINLDHIPGSKGVSATPEELKVATEKSMLNADYLRHCGLNPVIEVFHQDEPFELIKKLNDRRAGGCIALSPRNDVSLKQRELWLKQVLHYCLKTFGKQEIPPCHGLAVTTERLLKVFPFFSADSSTWISCLRFGHGVSAGIKRIPRYNVSDAARAATIHTLRAEVRKYKKIEQDMTNLWALRGIVWDEFAIN